MVDENHISSVIEENQRLSQSMLWQLQRKFFSQQGIKSWSKEIVPHYITSNPYIAQAYARMIFGWLRDVADTLDTTQPVYIVELGAGSGRLAYHFLKMFFDFFDESMLRDIPITYVMTDYSRTTRQFWKQHKQLQPWVESGRLDFAKFDAEQDETLALINRGESLSADTLKNPLALIANYFFDGLTQDVFWIENGELYENLITLTVPQSKPDLSDPNLLEQIKVTYEHCPIASEYYDDSDFNSLLETYRSTLNSTNLLFPIGSLECLRRLYHLSNGRLVLLTGDKGYHHESELRSRGEPKLSIHGSFSMKVNYHTLGKYVQIHDGQFLTTPHHHANLDICVALLGQHPHDYPETRYAYHQNIIHSNPDDFYTVKNAVDQQDQAFDVVQFLAFLRLCGWDSSIFLDYFPILLHSLDDLPSNMRDGLYLAMIQVWEMYYHIGEERDLPFALGRLLYELQYYTKASEFLHHSLLLYGSDATVFCNLALCHYELAQLDTALDFANRSLKIDSNFEPARVLQTKIADQQ